MDIPRPDGGDVNIGTDVVRASWVLTGFVAVVLIFRFAVKAWIRWGLPQVSAPRAWGLEDLFFLFGFAIDILHISLIQKSYSWGLGRHFYYLSAEQKVQALRYDYASQPCAVAAAMISRTGMMWFLLSCFANSNRRLRISIIVCMVIQVLVNSITIVQITVQCGPHPYRPADRTRYFHYMWDPLPSDGSVKCQSPHVQTTIGYVQGGFNTVIDLYLAVISAFELWQFFLQTLHRNPGVSIWAQFRRISPNVRSRRIWQTLTLSGPLVLSGAASIVKTYLLQSLGNRSDFTYNVVSFILWVKIENYAILIATCAPVIRLFLRTFVDMRREGGYPWSRSHSSGHQNNSNDENSVGQRELKSGGANRKGNNSRRDPDKSLFEDTCLLTTFNDERGNELQKMGITPANNDNNNKRNNNNAMHGPGVSNPRLSGVAVTIKTDIVVEVDEEMSVGSPDNEYAGPSSPRKNNQRRASTYALKSPV